VSARGRLRQGLRAIGRRVVNRQRLCVLSWWLALGVVLGGAVLGLVGAAALVGLGLAARLRVSDREAARAGDAALGLREQLGTAVESSISGDSGPLVSALIDKAAETSDGIDPKGVVPSVCPPLRQFRFPAIVGVVLGAALLTAAFWPRSQEQRQARKLTEMAKEIRREAPERLREDAEKLAESLEKLAEGFERSKVSKRQGLEQLGEIAEELRDRQDAAAGTQEAQDLAPAIEKLRNMHFDTDDLAALADALKNTDIESAQQKLGELAEKLRKGELSQEQLDKLAEDVRRMAKAMSESGQLAEMAEQLKKMAGSCEGGACEAGAKAAMKAAEMLAQAMEGADDLSQAEALAQLLQDLEFSQDMISGAGMEGGQEGEEGQDGQGAGSPSEGGFCSAQQVWSEEFNPDAPGGPGPGGGTTNQAQAEGAAGQEGYQDQVPQDDPETANYEEQYGARETEHGSENTRVRGQPTEGGEADMTEITASPDEAEAFLPYYDVAEAARAAKEDAMDDRSIPREYRERVRTYFESLDN